MIYNFMRFGSPFDFGIQYSLTINDFTHAEYHTKFVFIGFMNYLFTLPDFSSNFPFIHMKTAETFYPQGYYFTATGAVLGILWKALPVLSYCYSAKAYRSCTNSNKKLYTLLVAIVCVICPFVIIFSIWESGYSTRYSADFAWQIVLGALIIAFTVYNKCSKATKSHLNKLMTASTALCVIFTFAQTYVYVSPMNNWSYEWIASLLSFQRLFEFWR